MTFYIILTFVLSIFVLYKLSSSFSGAVVGAFTGLRTSSHLQHDIQELFFRTVFTLLGYIAKRDGAVNQKEVKRTEVYMEKMELDAAHKREAIRLFKLGAQPEFKIDKTIEQFRWLAKESPNLVQILLVYLINLARVDGLLASKEIEAVKKVALGLGYSDLTFNHLLKMVSAQNKFDTSIPHKAPQSEQTKKQHAQASYTTVNTSSAFKAGEKKQDSSKPKSCNEQTKNFEDAAEKNNKGEQLAAAYLVFDLSPTASDEEVKKSYRNLVNQYHPDKLVSLGLPNYMMQSATECFQKIQAAYSYIKETRKKAH